MNSGDLTPYIQDPSKPASAEVQFALIIARMIDSMNDNPEDMRHAVYELARYKLREQFTHSDASQIRQTEQALEVAIRGVEAFSKQNPRNSRTLLASIGDATDVAPLTLPVADHHGRPRSSMDAGRMQETISKPSHGPWMPLKRAGVMIAILVGVLLAIQQRDRLLSLVYSPPQSNQPPALEPQRPPAQSASDHAPVPLATKRGPLRPTEYGIYASNNDTLMELQALPGRPPDIRVAVSAAMKIPSLTVLPNGHPRFIVFRRDLPSTVSDRAEVRILAKIAREFSADVMGGKPADGEDMWVVRNISFPFRASPITDNPEMYELHSEDPALQLTPGSYALVLKTQAYGFSIEGEIVDQRQCIERIAATNGTFYSDCRKP